MLNKMRMVHVLVWLGYAVIFFVLRWGEMSDETTPFFICATVIPFGILKIERKADAKKDEKMICTARLLSACGLISGILVLSLFESKAILASSDVSVLWLTLMPVIIFLSLQVIPFLIYATYFTKGKEQSALDP